MKRELIEALDGFGVIGVAAIGGVAAIIFGSSFGYTKVALICFAIFMFCGIIVYPVRVILKKRLNKEIK
jgi:hypothetical protein